MGVTYTQEQFDRWFAAFWEAYPRKVGKFKALEKFSKALERVDDVNEIRVGVQKYNKQIEVTGTELRFVAHPATWLHQGRWMDDYITEIEQQELYRSA